MTLPVPAKTIDDLPFRPCVGIMLLNKQGRVFVGRRIDAGVKSAEHCENYAWQMPQGGIDEGEEPYAAALRELREETNVTSVSLIHALDEWLSYDLPGVTPERPWKGKWRGQRQKWFVLRFEGDESEINLSEPDGGAHAPEFSDWRWIDIADLDGLIVSFKRPVYTRLIAEFSHLSNT
jgi:putative (di)nucleoside polyphosphate hydrolase